ncbi:MAG TPA: hypothetical protein PLC04_06705 [Candidatus Kapabacteria bacterium]|nr:hypothetical protein [Candidatus Kapabacteria bacterium]
MRNLKLIKSFKNNSTQFLLLFLSLFLTAYLANAQQINVIFPKHSEDMIAIDAKIKLSTSSPYIFDTTSLPMYWAKDSKLIGRGTIWFVDEEYYSGTDSSLAVSSFLGGLGNVSSINPTLNEISISHLKEFYYGKTYGIYLSGIKLINTQTQGTVEIDTLILESFTTVTEPIQFLGTSFDAIPLTCADNSFLVHFNVPLEKLQTSQGPIITIDTVSMKINQENDSLIVTYHPINSALELLNDKKNLKVTLDENFDDSRLYYLNINLSRFTGNENDDLSFSFKSSSIATIKIHDGPIEELKPYYDSIYYIRAGRKITIAVPESNKVEYPSFDDVEYKFDRWICPDNPAILQGVADILPEIEIELTCENVKPELNFIPLYKTITFDTIKVIRARNSFGQIIGKIRVFDPYKTLDDTTFIFRTSMSEYLCYDLDENTGFSNWIINGQKTENRSLCINEETLGGLGLLGKASTWQPVIIENATPCSTIELTVTLQGTDDMNVPNGIVSILPEMKYSYHSDTLILHFIQDQTDPRKAQAQLTLPNISPNSFTLIFDDPVRLPAEYEYLTCNFMQDPRRNKGGSGYLQAFSRELEMRATYNKIHYSMLIPGTQNNNCNNEIELVIRPKRVYIDIELIMKNMIGVLPNNSLVGVEIYDENNKKIEPNNQYSVNKIISRIYTNIEDNYADRYQIYEVPINTTLKFAPYFDSKYAYKFYKWDSGGSSGKYLYKPISDNPKPYTIGPFLITKDTLIRANFDVGFRLESIRYFREDGEAISISTENDIDILPGERDESKLMGLNANVGYKLPPNYSEGRGLGTSRIHFIFNKGLDIDRWDSSAITIMDYTLLNKNRLDGYEPQIFYCVEGWPNYNIYGNTDFLTSDGKFTIASVIVRKMDWNKDYGFGLTPLSMIKILINPKLIIDEDGDTLSNVSTPILSTRYPMWQIYVEKARRANRKISIGDYGTYGFLWLQNSDTTLTGKILSMDFSNFGYGSSLRIPFINGFDGYIWNEIKESAFIEQLGSHSYLGMGYLFFDPDCGTWSEPFHLYPALIEKVDEIAKTKNAKEWRAGQYLSLAANWLIEPWHLCHDDIDDFIGEASLLARPNQGNYWDFSPKSRVLGPNYQSGYAPYIPMYRWNYYKLRASDIDLYFTTILH